MNPRAFDFALANWWVLDEDGPVAFRALRLTQEQTERIIKRMM
jgi:hypothetical protein